MTDSPLCPTHHQPMRRGSKGWFCTQKGGPKTDAKGYCAERKWDPKAAAAPFPNAEARDREIPQAWRNPAQIAPPPQAPPASNELLNLVFQAMGLMAYLEATSLDDLQRAAHNLVQNTSDPQ